MGRIKAASSKPNNVELVVSLQPLQPRPRKKRGRAEITHRQEWNYLDVALGQIKETDQTRNNEKSSSSYTDRLVGQVVNRAIHMSAACRRVGRPDRAKIQLEQDDVSTIRE